MDARNLLRRNAEHDGCEQMASLTVNGEKMEFEPGAFPATLSELLGRMNIAEATVVAEIDGEIVERSRFASASLRDGQTIELIRFIGGG
jgi:thiamine biosynthesis protein ThiS